MTDTIIIKGTSEESILLRRLQKIASTDTTRPVLTGLSVEAEYTIATDGFHLAVIETPECMKPCIGEIVQGKIPAGDFVAEMEVIEGTYPDWRGIIPTADEEYRIALSGKLLKSLCMLFERRDEPINFVFRAPDEVVELQVMQSDEDINMYGLLMPMHLSGTAAFQPDKRRVEDEPLDDDEE